jgi:hypothetical protein
MRLFVINLRAVKRVGLQMLPALRAFADRLVERRTCSFLNHSAGCATGYHVRMTSDRSVLRYRHWESCDL